MVSSFLGLLIHLTLLRMMSELHFMYGVDRAVPFLSIELTDQTD